MTIARAQVGTPTEATSPSGDRLLLYPDGRWEYADPAKRAAMREPPPAAVAPAAPPSTRASPPPATARGGAPSTVPPAPAATGAATQGGWLFGRRIPEGDPDYNRGSLNPKLR